MTRCRSGGWLLADLGTALQKGTWWGRQRVRHGIISLCVALVRPHEDVFKLPKTDTVETHQGDLIRELEHMMCGDVLGL